MKHHQHHLIVASLTRANLLVGGIRGEPTRVADGGNVNPVSQFPKLAFGAPETPQAEDRGLEALRIWPLERAAIDEMVRCRRYGLLAARQRRGGAWHLKFLLEGEHPDLLVDFALLLSSDISLRTQFCMPSGSRLGQHMHGPRSRHREGAHALRPGFSFAGTRPAWQCPAVPVGGRRTIREEVHANPGIAVSLDCRIDCGSHTVRRPGASRHACL